jgi:hypothetical protein
MKTKNHWKGECIRISERETQEGFKFKTFTALIRRSSDDAYHPFIDQLAAGDVIVAPGIVGQGVYWIFLYSGC